MHRQRTVAAVAAAIALAVPAAAQARTPTIGAQDERAFVSEPHDRDRALVAGRMMGARIWRSIVPWHKIETAPGVYDTAWLEQAVDDARSRGYRVYLTLGGTPYPAPEWADRPGPGQFHTQPRVRPFVRFARTVARALDGKVHAYSTWNEPDWTDMPPCLYRRLYVKARRAIRRVDRRPVLMGEDSPVSPLTRVRQALRCGRRPIVADGFAVHPYQWSYDLRENKRQGSIGRAVAMRRFLRRNRARLHTPAGHSLGVYFTEWAPFGGTERQEARQWRQGIRYATRARVRWLVAYHMTPNVPGAEWNTPMLRRDGSATRAFHTIRRRAGR